MHFFKYPQEQIPQAANYVVLQLDAPPLNSSDASLGLLLLDATWRLAEKMLAQVVRYSLLIPRSLPNHFRTAYPRRQEDCQDPTLGLASVEALYIAYHLLGRNPDGLLDHYHWKDAFLQKNSFPK